MHRTLKRNIAIGAAGLAAVAGAGGAYAATQGSGTGRQAYLNDVAKRLNVSPKQLTAALQGAALDQLAAEVKAGRLSQTQANALKQRLGQAPAGAPLFFGRPPGPRPLALAGGGRFLAAASYLGLTRAQLMNQLASGKSLAQIAKARGKSVAGLKQAMTAAIRARLDKAVARGTITKAQEQRLLSRLQARLDAQINGNLRLRRGYFGGPRGFASPRIGPPDGAGGGVPMPVPGVPMPVPGGLQSRPQGPPPLPVGPGA